jgi:hypothetical protein
MFSGGCRGALTGAATFLPRFFFGNQRGGACFMVTP